MNKLVAILVAFAALGILVPASAKPAAKCEAESDAIAIGERYVAVDLTGVYVYEEANGQDGLQRGGPQDPKQDTCQGLIDPDRLVI